jgi:exonuclease 3'-5' domain-containing protein 1
MRDTFLTTWIGTVITKLLVFIYKFAAPKPLRRAIMDFIKAETIDTTEEIKNLVDWLVFCHAPPVLHAPTMYVDLEGVNLGREDSLSILTLLIDTGLSASRVCLIDVHTLGTKAFETAGSQGMTLKGILQDEKIPKVFFDVRSDSDALFAHFKVALQGVEDVQLMESAMRKTTASRRLLNGLKKCPENNLLMSSGDDSFASWNKTKDKGKQLFKAGGGGLSGIFNQRPMCADVVSYCVGDVQHLPELREKFSPRTSSWRDLVTEETKRRVAASQESHYQPRGPDRAIAPWSEVQNTFLDQLADSLDDNQYDDGPTNCRDCIDDCDYHFYYDD